MAKWQYPILTRELVTDEFFFFVFHLLNMATR